MILVLLFVLSATVQGVVKDIRKCPDGTFRAPGSDLCYKFYYQLSDFFGAEAECVRNNGHLAFIGSNETNAFLAEKAKNLSIDEYYIGYTKHSYLVPSTNLFLATDSNKLMKYQNWYKKETMGDEKCVIARGYDGAWFTIDCIHPKPFVCSTKLIYPKSLSVCDSQWTYYAKTDSCYKLFLNGTWQEAEDKCVANQAHLTSIHSAEERKFITDMGHAGFDDINPGNSTWIGLVSNPKDPLSVESFKWSDGSSVDYQYWDAEQPDKIQERCVHFTTGKWDNYNCAIRIANYICKKPSKKITFK